MTELARTVATDAGLPTAVPPDRGIPALGGSLLVGSEPRYAPTVALGEGATGQVWLVEDRLLDRDVVAKIGVARLDQEGDDLIQEARTTAGLHHPNVLPVYDLAVTGDGRPFFTMPRVEGRTLGEVILASQLDHRDRLLPDFPAVVTVGIAICQAAACAHHAGLIHQDLKPDNILLGRFGEVLVLDWGSARSVTGAHGGVSGTPLYMAPEQARGESADITSDVYGIGATLFHALYLRPPLVPAADAERFWQDKRNGVIQPPTAEERRGVPPALAAIVGRALAVDPASRYADAVAMRQDLERFQSGLAVMAYAEPVFLRLWRWLRRHRRSLLVWGSVTLVVMSLLGLLWGERLKDQATWGEPILVEDFTDQSWSTRWVAVEGRAEVRDEALVTVAPNSTMLVLNRRLSGPTAIEYTGEMPLGTLPGDLSLMWISDFATPPGKSPLFNGRTWLQTGTFGNTFSSIQGDNNQWWAVSPVVLEPGRRHRIRAEIVERRMRLLLDGRLIAEHETDLAQTSGFVGIYTFNSGKRLDDVRVYSLGVPQRLPATAVADHLFSRGDVAAAAPEYARIAASWPGADGDEARYLEGLCRLKLEGLTAAERIWGGLAQSGPWVDQAVLARLDHQHAQGDFATAIPGLEAVALRRPELKAKIIGIWTKWIFRARMLPRIGELESLLALRVRCFPNEMIAERPAVEAIITLGQAARTRVEDFSMRVSQAELLAARGDFERLAREYADTPSYHAEALEALGLYDQARQAADPLSDPAIHLIPQGRAAEAIADPRRSPDGMFQGLMALGRSADAMAVPGVHPDLAVRGAWLRTGVVPAGWDKHFLLALQVGRLDVAWTISQEGMRANPNRHALGASAWPLYLAAVAAAQEGDHGLAARRCAAAQPLSRLNEEDLAVAQALLGGLIASRGGDFSPLREAAHDWITSGRQVGGQRPRYIARYLLGQCDEREFLAQPRQLGVAAWLAWVRALRAEMVGRPSEARTAWQAYQSLSALKSGMTVLAIADRVAVWRLAVVNPTTPER
jgi:hypothetical protein